MDLTDSYHEMCEMAPEVQSKWTPQPGDYYRAEGSSLTAFLVDPARLSTPAVWLPRQDQLQRLLGIQSQREFLVACHTFGSHPRWFEKAESPEQAWLMLVMREAYGKVWRGLFWAEISARS